MVDLVPNWQGLVSCCVMHCTNENHTDEVSTYSERHIPPDIISRINLWRKSSGFRILRKITGLLVAHVCLGGVKLLIVGQRQRSRAVFTLLFRNSDPT